MLLAVGSATPSGNVAHFENSTGSCYINPNTTSLSCSSDQRLKTNINPLADSWGLEALLQLNPVTYNWKTEAASTSPHTGFIAQQVQPILPDLISQGPDGYLTMNYAGLTPYLVKAIQEIATITGTFQANLTQWLASADNGIQDLFAKNIYATNGDFHQVTTDNLCARKSDGRSVCVTGDQLAALLSQTAGAGTPISVSSSGGGDLTNSGNPNNANQNQNGTGNSSSTATNQSRRFGRLPDLFERRGGYLCTCHPGAGRQPAHVSVGATYQDLGATITGPTDADKNLGLKYFLNGALVSNIVIDTTQVATDTIDYVATDSASLTSTSTRTVIIEAISPPPPPSVASSTLPVVATSSISTTR